MDCDVTDENSYLITIPDELPNSASERDDKSKSISFEITVDSLRLFVGSTLNLTMQSPCLAYLETDDTGKVSPSSEQIIYYSVTVDDGSSESLTFTSGDNDDHVIWTYTAYNDYIESADDLWVDETDISITITLTILDNDDDISNSNLVGDFYCELVFKVVEGIVE